MRGKLLDDRAREVLPEPHWKRETHVMVAGLRCRWPTLVARSRLDELLDELVDAPAFLPFWRTPIPVDKAPSTTIQLRDLGTGKANEYFRQTSQPDFPHHRPWRIYTLSPKSPAR